MKPLTKKTFLTIARASVDSPIFRQSFFEMNGKTVDILRNGDLSCAFFVSSLLKIFSLIKDIHATVEGTIKDMTESGWGKIEKPRAGTVIIWAPRKTENGETHRHIGICIDGKQAISNSSEQKVPTIHQWNYRPVELILSHQRLE